MIRVRFKNDPNKIAHNSKDTERQCLNINLIHIIHPIIKSTKSN
jgi:hypothetical protein